jgi:release factor glutamine methyltransferase
MNAERQAPTNESRGATIRHALRSAITILAGAGVPDAPFTAELLLMHSLNCDRTWLYAHSDAPLNDLASDRYSSLIARRAEREPTQHLTGHQEFWGLDFEVNRDVLIPRPETEHVVEIALQRLGVSEADSPQRTQAHRIADVGTGSGCIAVALALELPAARILATDISAAALAVAARNASRHNVADRIQFAQCDLLDLLPGEAARSLREVGFDLIVSNPPYIGTLEAASLAREVREHEPGAALFGGETGTELYAPLLAAAARHLDPGGYLVLELGHDSSQHVASLLDSAQWTQVAITADLAGIARVASAQRAG